MIHGMNHFTVIAEDLDRTLDFHDRTAEHAMIPRPQVSTVEAGEPVSRVVELMASGHSRFPVLGDGVDDIVGVICLRDVLALGERDLDSVRVSDVARSAVLVPGSLPLPGVLGQLRASDEEFACVVDEYGGLAGVITTEDIAEELVGEIADEHDPEDAGDHGPGQRPRRIPDLARDEAGRLPAAVREQHGRQGGQEPAPAGARRVQPVHLGAARRVSRCKPRPYEQEDRTDLDHR